jgi:hypothetical protein
MQFSRLGLSVCLSVCNSHASADASYVSSQFSLRPAPPNSVGITFSFSELDLTYMSYLLRK